MQKKKNHFNREITTFNIMNSMADSKLLVQFCFILTVDGMFSLVVKFTVFLQGH